MQNVSHDRKVRQNIMIRLRFAASALREYSTTNYKDTTLYVIANRTRNVQALNIRFSWWELYKT